MTLDATKEGETRAALRTFICPLGATGDRNSPLLAASCRVLHASSPGAGRTKLGLYQHFCTLEVVEVAGIEPASYCSSGVLRREAKCALRCDNT